MSTSDSVGRGASRTRLIVVTVAAVLIAALVAAFLAQRDRDTVTSAPPSPGQTSTSSTPVLPSIAPTGTLPTGQTVPTSAFGGVTWRLVGQVAVPYSATDGPAEVAAVSASGFAQTPVGALIAAVQISTRAGFSAGRASWEKALGEQFVASSDRDVLLDTLREAEAAGEQSAGPGELSQIAGFRYLSYTDETAVVGLVRRTPQGAYAMTTLTVRWQAGDWRLIAPAGGQWPAVTSSLSSLAGVVPWGAG